MELINEIRNDEQYNQALASIEKIIQRTTENGGFNYLAKTEKEELSLLSLLVEKYEDEVLKIMPLSRVNLEFSLLP